MLPKPNDGFDWVQAPSGPALVCRPLEPLAANFVTTRRWPLGSAAAGDDPSAWADVSLVAGVEPSRLVRARQVHGADVVVRRRDQHATTSDAQPHADIIVTNDCSLALAVQTADCVPLLLVDRRTGAVGAAHAGWRGLAARVPRVAVAALGDAFGSRAEDLVVAVGPSISAPKYEVDQVVRGAFEAAGFDRSRLGRWFLDGDRREHWQFDGWAAVRDQLHDAGVPQEQIHVAALCTASHPDLLCSYRRDGQAAGRMAAVIRARR